jgi:hypothetical protein
MALRFSWPRSLTHPLQWLAQISRASSPRRPLTGEKPLLHLWPGRAARDPVWTSSPACGILCYKVPDGLCSRGSASAAGPMTHKAEPLSNDPMPGRPLCRGPFRRISTGPSGAYFRSPRSVLPHQPKPTMATPIMEESACSDRRSGIDFRVQEARRAAALHRCYDAARDRGDARPAYLPGRAAIVGS